MAIEDLLKQNRDWAESQVRHDPDFFKRHQGGQSPRVLWIGCSDSRVPAEQILGCEPGEIFVHRNIANVVAYNDVNIAAVLQYSIEQLKIPDIVVCGHYGCGGVKASCQENVVGGYIGDWLMITRWAKRYVVQRHDESKTPIPAEEEFLRLVVEENVRLQINHLTMLSMVREQWQKTPGMPRLHGWVYDIGTGRIKVLETNIGDAKPNPT
jgi:carbonic anhydrase